MKGVFLALLISNIVNAQTKKVFYFGGTRATSDQMKCWESGARKGLGSEFECEGIPYPADGNPDGDAAVSLGIKDIERVAAEINSHPEIRYVVAGHSSGSALAIAVARKINNPKQIELVDIDGYLPPPDLQNRVNTTCVFGENPAIERTSRNAGLMKTCKNFFPVINEKCKTVWCLHFAPVNSSAPSELSGSDFAKKGYEGCDSNTEWIKKLFKKPSPTPIGTTKDTGTH